jgi:uncharacterized protein
MDIGAEALSLGRLLVLQFARIFPFWMGGLVVGSLISVFARERIARAAALINERKWVAGRLALAAGVGVASPICMYGTIPILASLGRKGAPHYLLASFMVSSILLNPSLLVFSFALGAPLALLRLAVCLGAGMVAGVAVNALFKKAPLFSFERFCAHNRRQDAAPGLREYLRELNAGIVRTTPYFLLGIALTALMDRYFPRDWIAAAFGRQGVGVLFAASLGVPAYICGGGTIPILKFWLGAGMSPGSALAFMVSGPATKLTNLGAVKIILGARNFILYLLFILAFAVAAGLAVDAAFSLGLGGP